MSFLQNIKNAFLDAIYPPVCALCGAPGRHPLCLKCVGEIYPEPFSWSLTSFNVTTIMPYDDFCRDAIHKLKYEGVEDIGHYFADLATPFLENFAPRHLVPVPMHPIKIRSRGYNQAAIIAKRLSANLGWPYAGRVIWRTRNTRPQFDIDFDERLDNVKDAFSKYPLAKVDKEARYMIIDDIITTGATMVYCHKALRDAGAKKIDAFAVARAGTKELTTLVMQKVMY